MSKIVRKGLSDWHEKRPNRVCFSHVSFSIWLIWNAWYYNKKWWGEKKEIYHISDDFNQIQHKLAEKGVLEFLYIQKWNIHLVYLLQSEQIKLWISYLNKHFNYICQKFHGNMMVLSFLHDWTTPSFIIDSSWVFR